MSSVSCSGEETSSNVSHSVSFTGLYRAFMETTVSTMDQVMVVSTSVIFSACTSKGIGHEEQNESMRDMLFPAFKLPPNRIVDSNPGIGLIPMKMTSRMKMAAAAGSLWVSLAKLAQGAEYNSPTKPAAIGDAKEVPLSDPY